jgi:hypothetical protein
MVKSGFYLRIVMNAWLYKKILKSLTLSFCVISLSVTAITRAEAPYEEEHAQERQYNRVATRIAGVTLISLVAGVGVLALGTKGRKHCYHSGSNYSFIDPVSNP